MENLAIFDAKNSVTDHIVENINTLVKLGFAGVYTGVIQELMTMDPYLGKYN